MQNARSDFRDPPPPRPLPVLEGLVGEFYGWCRKRELRFQVCLRCRAWRHPPRPVCAACAAGEWEWRRSTGDGTLYTWTVVERALDPAFARDVPYVPAIVELAEGPRLATAVTGVLPDRLAIGMAVRVWFDPISEEVWLPKFEPASGERSPGDVP